MANKLVLMKRQGTETKLRTLTPTTGVPKLPTTALPLFGAKAAPGAQGKCAPRALHVLAPPTTGVTMNKKERDTIIKETAQREADLPLLTVVRSQISLFSWEQMKSIAGNILVTNTNLTGYGSVMDPRMGVVSLTQACQHCGIIDCPGHYGLIDFRRPIYNPEFIREIVAVLTCVCNDCGGLLVTEDIIKHRGLNRVGFEKRLTEIEKYCKELQCLRKKPKIEGGALIPCSKNPVFVTEGIKEKGEITFKIPQQDKTKATKDDPPYMMPMDTVIKILDRISDEDAKLLGFPRGSHPRNMIQHGILVSPVISRPPVNEGGEIHHDQITHMYKDIMSKEIDSQQGKAGAAAELYNAVKHLIFKTEGKKVGQREFLSIVERIQGKTALLRGLLMGKRNNYCGRTVSGPDPSLRFGQIRIPEIWAPILTAEVKVTDFNIRELTALMDDGKITHYIPKNTGLRKFYSPTYKPTLKVGDKVERWLQNGDRIVINRQPTLHRQSMMAYEVVLGYQLTIGLHLSYTTPMNNDFDGDENNAWTPRDFQVVAEAELLMNVKHNTMSSEQNRPIMGWVMNCISGAYLLTHPDTRINDDLFAELLTLVTHTEDIDTLYPRLLKYGVHPRSGQAIFSAMLPSDFCYNHKGVVIAEGVLVSGRIKKAHIGAAHRSIIQELHKQYGDQRTADFFTDGPWVINKWLVERGFSVGLRDMIDFRFDDEGHEYDHNTRVLKEELTKIYVQLDALGNKLDDPIEEEYRQRQIVSLVNIAQGIGMRLAKDLLKGDNSIGVMSDQGGGAKGDVVNIGQMMGSVGQQFYRGRRLAPALSGGHRLLPTFDMDDTNPEANAFIPVSFFTGLSPENLFFLQAGGREGILDTALKTADTGAMQHRMIKAFENIIIGPDGSVRNTVGTMFSPMYNSGFDIGEMLAVETLGKPDFSSFIDISAIANEANIKRGWVPEDVNAKITTTRAKVLEGLKPDTILKMPANYVKQPLITDTQITYDITQEVPVAISSHKITRFERSRIIGTRAMQLSNNAPPLVDIGTETDPVNIAMKEYAAGVLDLFIVRKFADGSHTTLKPSLDNI